MDQSFSQGLYDVAAEDWPAYRDARIAAVAAGGIEGEELALTTGRILKYECFVLPDGGRMLTYYDITTLKHAQARLRQHLDGMEVSMDGMALLDAEGRYLYVNSAHAAFYGHAREEMIGMNWRELYSEAELARFDREILPVLGALKRWRGEATGIRKSGRPFPQELSLAIRGDGGIVCVVRDISERKSRERALDQALSAAERSSAAKSRFLASMSHELRTPLNAIIGFTRIVARRTRGQIPAQQSDNLTKIQSSGEHLLRLINEILDISKIEAGRMEITRAPFSPGGVVEECLRLIQPMAKPDVALIAEVQPGLDGAVGDAGKVRQIVMNLLANAARHTETGSITARATIADGRLRISVRDTGPGIPPEMAERIFDEFAQAREGPEPARTGTGLGLTISRRLARLMGGEVSVESAPGHGASFMLDLPARMPDPSAAKPAADTGAEVPQ